METTFGKIAGRTLLAIAECAALVIASTVTGQALRHSTTRATEGMAQAFRYTQNRFHQKAA